MKKTSAVIFALLITVSLLLSLTVATSAANDPPDKDALFEVRYGSAVIDGKKDDTYFIEPSVKSYVHKASYETADYDYPEGKETRFDCYLLWDETGLYGFIEVQDFTPVTYAFSNYKTDCVELNFILNDWQSFAGNTSPYGDTGNLYLGMFRISNPVGHTASALYELLPSKGGLGLFDEVDGLSKLVTVKTETGYNIEFSIKIPDDVVHVVCTPGQHIGFGIQCNDDINDNGVRDAIIYSSNLDDTHGKTGEFILLDRQGNRLDAPVVREPVSATTVQETTVAPVVTTAQPAETTSAPVVTTAAPAVETTTVDVTSAPVETKPDTVETDDNKGCGSSLGATVAVMCLVFAGAAFIRRRGN